MSSAATPQPPCITNASVSIGWARKGWRRPSPPPPPLPGPGPANGGGWNVCRRPVVPMTETEPGERILQVQDADGTLVRPWSRCTATRAGGSSAGAVCCAVETRPDRGAERSFRRADGAHGRRRCRTVPHRGGAERRSPSAGGGGGGVRKEALAQREARLVLPIDQLGKRLLTALDRLLTDP